MKLYYGLRDYGTAKWEGGDSTCSHDQRRREHDDGSMSGKNGGTPRDSLAGKDTCRLCGARRIDNQIGLEATPAQYIASLVAVFAEVKRVLHPTGVCFLNLGSSFTSGTIESTDYALRDDLSPDEIAYVLRELANHVEKTNPMPQVRGTI